MPAPLTQTIGRRKEAVARVRLRPGNGTITVNGRAFESYFTSAVHRTAITEPLRLASTPTADGPSDPGPRDDGPSDGGPRDDGPRDDRSAAADSVTYDVDATLDGGGISGQAGALRLGIARSLVELDPDVRPRLKRAGLLHRDARAKESKKYGLKKARKAPQYSKR